MTFFTILETIDKDICSVFPPHINSFLSVVVNLPIILLYIISLPPRFFLCILASITNVPLLGLLANLFPPSTLFCSIVPGSSNTCYSECPGCQSNAKCVSLPNSYIKFCNEAKPYFSLLNEIFCLIGYVTTVILLPIIELINIVLAPTGNQLCISYDVNNCFSGEQNGL